MIKKSILLTLLKFLAIGIIAVGSFACCTKHNQSVTKSGQFILRTETKCEVEEVTCTFPHQLKSGYILFSVDSIRVKDANGNSIQANHKREGPNVSFKLNNAKLIGSTFTVLYKDVGWSEFQAGQAFRSAYFMPGRWIEHEFIVAKEVLAKGLYADDYEIFLYSINKGDTNKLRRTK